MRQKKYKPKHYAKKTKKDIVTGVFRSIICTLALINCMALIVGAIIIANFITAPYEKRMQETEDTELVSADVIIDLNDNEHIIIQKVKVSDDRRR